MFKGNVDLPSQFTSMTKLTFLDCTGKDERIVLHAEYLYTRNTPGHDVFVIVIVIIGVCVYIDHLEIKRACPTSIISVG